MPTCCGKNKLLHQNSHSRNYSHIYFHGFSQSLQRLAHRMLPSFVCCLSVAAFDLFRPETIPNTFPFPCAHKKQTDIWTSTLPGLKITASFAGLVISLLGFRNISHATPRGSIFTTPLITRGIIQCGKSHCCDISH